MNKAVFLDRDGTLIEERHYLKDPAGVALVPGAAQAVKELHSLGYLVIVISNQSGVARGYFGLETVHRIDDRINKLLRDQDTWIDAFYICPHHPDGCVPEYSVSCGCRKPLPGMALTAAKDFGINLRESYMIGDKMTDVEFGKAFGARESFLVLTGHGIEEQKMSDGSLAYGIVCGSIADAADRIIKRKSKNI